MACLIHCMHRDFSVFSRWTACSVINGLPFTSNGWYLLGVLIPTDRWSYISLKSSLWTLCAASSISWPGGMYMIQQDLLSAGIKFFLWTGSLQDCTYIFEDSNHLSGPCWCLCRLLGLASLNFVQSIQGVLKRGLAWDRAPPSVFFLLFPPMRSLVPG